MIYRTFTALGLEDFQIRLNNRKVLSGLFDLLGLGDKATDVMRTIDKLEKIGKEKVLEVLTGEFAVAEDAASKLLEVLESADPMEALETLKGQNELLDTGMGKCRMCVAGPRNFVDDESRALRVATKFVNIARDHYERRGRDIDIVKLNGSIELAPILGLSDVIVDIVETGTTLKENDLTVIEEFMPISARFIANKASYKFKYAQLTELLTKMKEALAQ